MVASEYHWSRECIWWEVDFAEMSWYISAIIQRKKAEARQSSGEVTDEMEHLYNVIEQVKREKGL